MSAAIESSNLLGVIGRTSNQPAQVAFHLARRPALTVWSANPCPAVGRYAFDDVSAVGRIMVEYQPARDGAIFTGRSHRDGGTIRLGRFAGSSRSLSLYRPRCVGRHPFVMPDTLPGLFSELLQQGF